MPFAFCPARSLFARLALSVRMSVLITHVIQYAQMSFSVSVFFSTLGVSRYTVNTREERYTLECIYDV